MYVTEITPEGIVVDFNHPLAGETLHFDVKNAGIRPATADEILTATCTAGIITKTPLAATPKPRSLALRGFFVTPLTFRRLYVKIYLSLKSI